MTPEEQAALEAKEAEEKAKAEGADDGASEAEAELVRIRKALKEANKEAAERRKRLEELEKAEAERKAAELSESEKLKAELETARNEAEKAKQDAREMLIRSAFVAEAAAVGAAHPEDVYLLADKSEVEVNDAGAVEGVAEAVKALVDSGRIPLAGRSPAPKLDGGAGGGDRSSQQVRLSPLEAELAQKFGMTPERYLEQKAAIKKREQGEEYETLTSVPDAKKQPS